MTYNVSVLGKELRDAGLPVVGVNSRGEVSWEGEPSKSQLSTAKTVVEAHDPLKQLSLEVNILELLAKEFPEEEAELNSWANESIFVANILTDKSFKATKATVAMIKARVEKSKEDGASALTATLADKLLAKIAELDAQLV